MVAGTRRPCREGRRRGEAETREQGGQQVCAEGQEEEQSLV